MTDSNPQSSASQAPSILEYPIERRYQSTGFAPAPALLLTLSGGLCASVVGALVAFVWIVERIPSFLFLPLLAQGVIVGATLAWLVRRYRIRSRVAAVLIAAVCGIAGAALFDGALYVRGAFQFRDLLRQHWISGGSDTRLKPLVDFTTAHPFREFDRVMIARTGHRGLLGYMLFRGRLVIGMALVQILVVAWVAGVFAGKSASRPYCEGCNSWCGSPVNAAVLPASAAPALVAAIESEDPNQVLAVHLQSGSELAGSCAIARVHTCPRCGKQYADVIVKTFGRTSARAVRLSPRRVSPEMVIALRYEPPKPALPADAARAESDPNSAGI